MSQEPDQQAQTEVVQVAVGLAYVCRYLKDICEILRSDGDDPGQKAPLVVRRVIDAMRTGADLRVPLETPHTVLRTPETHGACGVRRAR